MPDEGGGAVSPQQGGRDAQSHAQDPVAPVGGPFDWMRRETELLERGDAGPAAVLLGHAATYDPGSASVCEALARALAARRAAREKPAL